MATPKPIRRKRRPRKYVEYLSVDPEPLTRPAENQNAGSVKGVMRRTKTEPLKLWFPVMSVVEVVSPPMCV